MLSFIFLPEARIIFAVILKGPVSLFLEIGIFFFIYTKNDLYFTAGSVSLCRTGLNILKDNSSINSTEKSDSRFGKQFNAIK